MLLTHDDSRSVTDVLTLIVEKIPYGGGFIVKADNPTPLLSYPTT
jgi:hypothetical protein